MGLAVVAVFGACGGTSGDIPDAGVAPVTAQLVILDPPGDILGLKHAESITMRVRYETEDLEPITDAKVDFMLEGTEGKSTGGATLSRPTATTDATGVARVDLLAGASDASFVVRVTAPNATPVTFFATVSAGGFADLSIKPVHSGFRDPTSFERVEVRLYHATDVRCDTLDVDAPPASVFPPRSMGSFDGVAGFRNVRARTAYTLAAWAVGGASSTHLAAGCVDLGPEQLPASPAAISIAVVDREPPLPPGAVFESAFDVSALAAAVDQAGHERPWRALGCPAGPGQLLLDCALDAMGGDGSFDCVVENPSGDVAAIEAKRGAAVDGCRPAMLPGAEPSIDALLTNAVDSGKFPVGPGLEAVIAGRANTMDLFSMRSELRLGAAGSAVHRLVSVSLDISGIGYTVQLAQTARPVIMQRDVSVSVSQAQGLDVQEHGFSLRYGSLAMRAFKDVVLASEGLEATAHTLGTALVGAMTEGGETGCPAVSKIACVAAGLDQGCLVDSCAAALQHLDQSLDGWWRYLDGDGLDFIVEGSAPLYDASDDLSVDAIGLDGNGTQVGVWTATMRLGDGSTIEADGAFGSVMLLGAAE